MATILLLAGVAIESLSRISENENEKEILWWGIEGERVSQHPDPPAEGETRGRGSGSAQL